MPRITAPFSLVAACILCATCAGDDGDGDSPLPSGFHNRLTETGGCGDIFVFASNEDDSISLSFRADGLVEEALAAGGETTTPIVLSDGNDGYVVTATTGRSTSADFCTDVVVDPPLISTTWRSISGTVTVTIDPGDRPEGSRASVLFENVVLEPVALAEDVVTIERFEIIDVAVGWLPG